MWALTWINQNLTNGNLGEPGFYTSPFWKQEADYRIVFKIMKSVLFQSFSKMKLAPALKIIGPVKFYEIKIFLFLTSLSVNLGASKIKLLVSLKILVNRSCLGKRILYHWATWKAPDTQKTVTNLDMAGTLRGGGLLCFSVTHVYTLTCTHTHTQPWSHIELLALYIHLSVSQTDQIQLI